MMKLNKIEPMFKKVLIVAAIVITCICIAYSIFEYNQINLLHKEQIEVYQGAIGTIVEKYPEMESDIVKNLFNKSDNAKGYGKEILNKYGYDLDLSLFGDPLFKDYRSSYIKNNVIVLIIVLMINFIALYLIGRIAFRYLNNISGILESFIKGDFNYTGKISEEGMVNVISSQLNQLGKNIRINYTNLDREKESTKELITDISHQLKTPLASLSMCNSILEDESITPGERAEFLEMSKENIDKLHGLIDSLVNISRLEVAMIKLKPNVSSLRDTILRAYNSAFIKANNKGINLEIGEMNDELNIKHDCKWTEEAIFNVLDNGIKYTKSGGQVSIDVEESLNYIKVHIRDTGIGIDKKEFNDIFKRFYRNKDHEKNKIEGSGVGLYLTRKILEDQGGSVMVKSKIGEGTTFTILLPKLF